MALENISVIYAIKNRVNGKMYIGSAVSMRRRINVHICHLRKKAHHSPSLQRAWNKYGQDNFDFIILENVDDHRLLIEREQFYLDLHKTYINDIGYNISPTAGSLLSKTHSVETKRILSEKGKSLETVQRCKQLAFARIGTKFTKEQRERLSKALTGVKKSANHAKKVGNARAVPVAAFDDEGRLDRIYACQADAPSKPKLHRECKSHGFYWRRLDGIGGVTNEGDKAGAFVVNQIDLSITRTQKAKKALGL